ncbi:hypothetical protein SEVIR_2G379850v4 [Setaria viridis]
MNLRGASRCWSAISIRILCPSLAASIRHTPSSRNPNSSSASPSLLLVLEQLRKRPREESVGCGAAGRWDLDESRGKRASGAIGEGRCAA